MKSKIFQNVYVPGISCIRVISGIASSVAISMAALAPACVAQTASVEVPTPPAAIAAATTVSGANNSISRVASGAETLHVIVGHSLFLNTKLRLRRVYVADPAILNSITVSPSQLLVTAMTPGVSSLILIDESGQAQSYVVSSDLDIQGMRTAISEAMKENTVSVEAAGESSMLDTLGTIDGRRGFVRDADYTTWGGGAAVACRTELRPLPRLPRPRRCILSGYARVR